MFQLHLATLAEFSNKRNIFWIPKWTIRPREDLNIITIHSAYTIPERRFKICQLCSKSTFFWATSPTRCAKSSSNKFYAHTIPSKCESFHPIFAFRRTHVINGPMRKTMLIICLGEDSKCSTISLGVVVSVIMLFYIINILLSCILKVLRRLSLSETLDGTVDWWLQMQFIRWSIQTCLCITAKILSPYHIIISVLARISFFRKIMSPN